MAKKRNLREFQSHLANRLANLGQQNAAGLLGVQVGSCDWLIKLSDAGEIVPLSYLTPVPMTKPWFAGLANIRGDLFSVIDFSAFQGQEPTPRNASARLLLVGARYGNNAALLVNRMLGLRKLEGLQPSVNAADAQQASSPSWLDETYTDQEGRFWKQLNVPALLADEAFMQVGC
ncbi:MAG: chemotaxis protein CheW [Pseudomonadota bacterium]